MATLRDIKRRIVGVKSTQKITRAMKMVATAKLRRAQQRIVNARPYARKISEMLSHLATEEDFLTNPFIVKREPKKVCVVIVTSDRGLCGAFNTNIIKEAIKHIDEEFKYDANTYLYCVGKKSSEHFGRRNYEIAGKNIGLFSSLGYQSALQLYNEVVPKFLSGEYDKVVLIYNEFISMVQQKIAIEQFLPIPLEKYFEKEIPHQPNYIYEPSQRSIFEYLIPKHLKAQIWRILLESNAAELGARMTAMDNATTNAQELIRSLNLTYNKERQAAITKEILEIVSGANALKASS
jgi:F-type H+-transporting ATPase subunit gamma